jgi:hypothetical protein
VSVFHRAGIDVEREGGCSVNVDFDKLAMVHIMLNIIVWVFLLFI